MALFTDISIPGTPYLSLGVVNELIESLNARLSPTNTTDLIDVLVEGDVVQSVQLWLKLQNAVLALEASSNWCNYDGADTYHSVPLTVYSATNLSTFYYNAGIPSGFRRATVFNPMVNVWTDYADPMYSYGLIQEGDILGPWILHDIQSALEELKRFLITRNYSWCSFVSYTSWEGHSGVFEPSWLAAYNTAVANWHLDKVTAAGLNSYGQAYVGQAVPAGFQVLLQRIQFTVGIAENPAAYPSNTFPFVPLGVGTFVNAESNGGTIRYLMMEGGGFAIYPFENFGDPIYRGGTDNEYTLLSEHTYLGSDPQYPISDTFGGLAIPPFGVLDLAYAGALVKYTGYREHHNASLEPIFPYTR